MAEPIKSIDVASRPELLELAEEVRRANRPCVLRRGDDELAVIAPVRSADTARPRASRRSTRVVTREWLDSITNVIDDDGASDVAENKHKYLAEAYDRPNA
jgi:hypothetical protein